MVWLAGEVRTPPFSVAARIEAGALLRRVQDGETPGMPHCRPMPVIGPRCYELRVQDEHVSWRIMARIDEDAVVILDVVRKGSRTTPLTVVRSCRDRLRRYVRARGGTA